MGLLLQVVKLDRSIHLVNLDDKSFTSKRRYICEHPEIGFTPSPFKLKKADHLIVNPEANFSPWRTVLNWEVNVLMENMYFVFFYHHQKSLSFSIYLSQN